MNDKSVYDIKYDAKAYEHEEKTNELIYGQNKILH